MNIPREKISWKERFRRVFSHHQSPHEIALGVAAGVFIGVTPLYGFHTLLVIVTACIFKRVNVIAMLLGTSISTTPTVPFITWGGYSLGRVLLRGDYPPFNADLFRKMFQSGLGSFYRSVWELYFPLFVGSVVLGIFLGIIFYFLTLVSVSFWKRRKRILVDN